MGMISEFKEFIARGNVIDLAVAVVIGAAFGKIVTALVDGIVMPVIAALTGGVSVDDWKYVVTPQQLDASGKEVVAELSIRYGLFLQSVIDFVLVAFVIFLVLKAYNRMRKPAAEAPAATPEDVLLLREIRDSLRAR
ncbi:large-conductance mechanosensitive channel protein MscL [Lysobacter koreensis]|uniref:Large-conductance mechanosensitive channel n=1 Tax=Lysobacter koreensis TaxID=266122 RepID=A0ABW2YM11_9GAMM